MEAYDVFVSVKPKPKQPSKVSYQIFFLSTKFLHVIAQLSNYIPYLNR